MVIDNTIIYLIVICAVALILLLVGMVFSYANLLSKFLNIKNKKEAEIQKELENIYKDTEMTMHKITADTYERSASVIRSVEVFAEKQTKLLGDELNKSTSIYTKLFNNVIEEFRTDTKNTVTQIPGEIQKIFSEELEVISHDFRQGLEKISEDVKNAMQKSYTDIENEVEEYKIQRIKQIDSSLSETIAEIARKVLVKEINRDEHEKLVMKALDEAKKDGFFS